MNFEVRSLAAALSLVAIAVILPAQVGDEEGANPTLRVEEPNLDLGRVVAGKVVTGTFIFHNESEKDVKIVRAKPS
jgi:hypothetical protein